MTNNPDPIESFWDNLLSEEPERIRAAFASLEDELRPMVIAHLKRMVTEEGWLPQQVMSAQAALNTLEDKPGAVSPDEME